MRSHQLGNADLGLLSAASDFSIEPIRGDKLFERIPILALTGEDSALDLILDEVLSLLISGVGADVGQINLLPRGGRVEKVYVIKDGKPWMKKGMELHLFDPHRGFTGRVIASGRSILVKDIWAKGTSKDPNPFLGLVPSMNKRYVAEIKRPVASIIIAPIKRGQDVFCTIELGRYRHRDPFSEADQKRIDDFARRYGSLIMDYILDVRDRLAINTAHKKLLSLARLIASNKPVDYRDAVEAYMNLSAADLGFVFFQVGDPRKFNYRVLAWQGDAIHELFLKEFIPSPGSILRSSPEMSFPVEGKRGDRRITRFYERLMSFPGLPQVKRCFLLDLLKSVESYVAYSFHMLGQDLGAVVLGSRRPQFWDFLHMNPFLSLYNSLLKSFLLNERLIYYLSDVSLKIHNPGFYCLAALKGRLASEYPDTLRDSDILEPLNGLESLLGDLHDQGKVLRSRQKNINLLSWLNSFIRQKAPQLPHIDIKVESDENGDATYLVRTSEEQLETIFENLFCNSKRAISARQLKDPDSVGLISIKLCQKKDRIRVRFQDNGLTYPTVSGRGTLLIRAEMQSVGGSMRIYKKPYRVFLDFPRFQQRGKEAFE